MGFYDCRCMVTGVSLKGADAALVLLRQSADRYDPLALAIKGNYNRLGSIDGIEEDVNSRLVLKFFLEGLQSGVFIVDEEYLRGHDCFPITNTEELLQGFERNMNDGPGAAILDGQSVVFALVARVVWDRLAASPTAESAESLFGRHFETSSAASRIYAGALEPVSEDIRQLAAVDSFLTNRGLGWRPTEATGQDYAKEMRQYLTEARRAYSDSPAILASLRDYEDEVGHLIGDG